MWTRRRPKPPPELGDLQRIQAFVNTASGECAETFTSPDALRDWLARQGLVARKAKLVDGDLKRAMAVRQGLKALLWANNGGRFEEDRVAGLNRAVAGVPLEGRFEDGGELTLAPDADGLAGALGHLLAIIATAQKDGSWLRLKLCANPSCRQAFYDGATNRSRRWCRALCANRVHAPASRRRYESYY